MDIPTSPDASLPSEGSTIQISESTFRTITDQLQRLNRNNDNHDQLIHDLRSELSSLKSLQPQLEALKEQNGVLKREVEMLRHQNHTGSKIDEDTVMTKEEEKELTEIKHSSHGKQVKISDTIVWLKTKVRAKSPDVVEVLDSDDECSLNSTAISRPTRKRRLPSGSSESAAPITSVKRIKSENLPALRKPARLSPPVKKVEPETGDAKLESMAAKLESSHSKAKPESAQTTVTQTAPGPCSTQKLAAVTVVSRTKIPSDKIKSGALFFPKTVLEDHLTGTSTLTISPQPLGLKMHLPFLGTEYKAATQALLWTNDPSLSSGKKPTPSIVRRFLYPNFETNPDMPAAPGEPGLLLCGRTEPVFDSTPWSLFIRVIDDSSTLKRWTYAGEYTCTLVGHLSASAFKAQPFVVKQTWGKKIAFHKKHPAYRDMRARMTLRKYGLVINEENMKKEIKRAGKTKKGDETRLSISDVVKAFEKGDETIPIIRLQCASYNHEFAQELATKYARYKPKQKKTADSDAED